MGDSDKVTAPVAKAQNYRFTGHDTFHCRYAWLPKAVRLVDSDNLLFSNDDKAMVEIGVGKNMVQSIQFWAEASGVIELTPNGRGFQPSKFGRLILQELDPYLENEQTLWLLHWKIATNPAPLFAWDFLLNSWHRRDFVKSEVIEAFQKEAQKQGSKLSASTLETHFEVFLHSYIPTKSRKGEVLEDNLDCPLVELRLLTSAEDRVSKDGDRREPAYSYRIDDKHEISDELFIYCLNDFWNFQKTGDQLLDFRTISVAPGSPGQIFKISERAIRDRLDKIEAESNGVFIFEDTSLMQQVRRTRTPSPEMLLERIYRRTNRNN